MNDDVSTTASDEPTTEDAPAEALEVEAVSESTDDGGGETNTGMRISFEVPSAGRLLVGLGGAIMALSTLFSWWELGNDSFPNIAGVGQSTLGVGLAVLLVGLVLLLKPKSVGATLGLTLGGFAITLIYIFLVGPRHDYLGRGAWIGLAGTVLAVLGALFQALESRERPTLDCRPGPAALGAVLAVVASFWLDWMLEPPLPWGRVDTTGPLNGLDMDVLFGLPILILGAVALVCVAELVSIPGRQEGAGRSVLLGLSQAAGIAITVIAGSNVLGMVMMGRFGFGSAPLVALVGGVMLIRSIREA